MGVQLAERGLFFGYLTMTLQFLNTWAGGFKRLIPALFLGLVLVLTGCSSTTSNTASYGGPSVSSASADRTTARRSIRSAKRDVRAAKREVSKLERAISHAERRMDRKRTSAADKKELKKSIRSDKRALRTAKRDVRRAERKLSRAERAEEKAKNAVASAKRRKAEAERKLALADKRKRAEQKRRDQEEAQREVASAEPRRRLTSGLFGLSDPALKNIGDYGARVDNSFSVAAIPVQQINKRLLRQEVRYSTRHKKGTIIVDPNAKYLYLVLGGNRAMRYGIGVGKAGFEWQGTAHIGWKQEWPKWTPPAEMIERRPDLAKWGVDNGGMPGGPNNPLGARALYLMQGGVDTLYRLHGTPAWQSIGTAASSGCIRLMNQDIIDLYGRVRNGAKVVVL